MVPETPPPISYCQIGATKGAGLSPFNSAKGGNDHAPMGTTPAGGKGETPTHQSSNSTLHNHDTEDIHAYNTIGDSTQSGSVAGQLLPRNPDVFQVGQALPSAQCLNGGVLETLSSCSGRSPNSEAVSSILLGIHTS